MIKDLRSYLDYLSKKGKLAHVKSKVSPELEISAFTNKENSEHRNESRALVFDNVDGYGIPVATNLMGSASTLSDLFSGFQMADILGSLYNSDGIPIIKSAKTVINSRPRLVKKGFGGYEKLSSLDEIPILKTWPGDSGRFITLPLVITESPSDGSTNVGIYRMQVFDGETTGMHWQVQKGGAIHAAEALEAKKELNVSVAIGTDPYNIISAVAPLPHGINEFSFAGAARGSRTDLIDCDGYPPVPSNSEIIIKGHIDPSEKRDEGPFGDHTGYYSIKEPMHVFHIDGIYAKKDAIYAASVVGFPWNEDCVAGQFLMDYLKPMIKFVSPNIVDIFLPPEGAFTNLCFVSLKKRFPGDAKKTIFSLLGLGQLSLTKMIVAFDDDIDVRDMGRVMWALSTRVDPERDVQILNGTPTDTLDHASNVTGYGSKMLIDATKKSRQEGYFRDWPDVIIPDAEISREVDKKWKQIS